MEGDRTLQQSQSTSAVERVRKDLELTQSTIYSDDDDFDLAPSTSSGPKIKNQKIRSPIKFRRATKTDAAAKFSAKRGLNRKI